MGNSRAQVEYRMITHAADLAKFYGVIREDNGTKYMTAEWDVLMTLLCRDAPDLYAAIHVGVQMECGLPRHHIDTYMIASILMGFAATIMPTRADELAKQRKAWYMKHQAQAPDIQQTIDEVCGHKSRG